GALAGAAGSHQGPDLAGTQLEVDPLEHRLPGRVAEGNSFEPNLSLHSRQLDRVRTVADLRLHVQQPKDPFRRCPRLLEIEVDVAEVPGVRPHEIQDDDELCQGPDRQLTARDLTAAKPQDEGDAEGAERFNNR